MHLQIERLDATYSLSIHANRSIAKLRISAFRTIARSIATLAAIGRVVFISALILISCVDLISSKPLKCCQLVALHIAFMLAKVLCFCYPEVKYLE
jgi:hypothetical protein